MSGPGGLRPEPAVYTVPSGLPFVDALVVGLLKGGVVPLREDDPLALSRVTILLPTRRACRALRDAFVRHSARHAMLLPRIRPLGDLDDDEADLGGGALADGEQLPPAIAPLHRQLLLTRLILGWDQARHRGTGAGAGKTVDQAARLARELARLLDQVQTERLDFSTLAGLAPARYAEHWQTVLDFLALLTEHWPKILDELGMMDPAARRTAALERIAARWRAAPPPEPVLAAGSTGSLPATADLLATVAMLPTGCVVLPGLDRGMDDASWEALGPSHPQQGLKHLLNRIGVVRQDVPDWPAPGLSEATAPRARLIAEAMRPAGTTEHWRTVGTIDEAAIEGLTRIDCASPQEEAGVIALLLRAALESEERTAALVTADRALARRVAAELKRWRVEVDDSAGTPLAETPPGVFLRLSAALAARGAAPVPLLAALKHPFAAGGEAPVKFRQTVRRLETARLRGPRPAPGIAGLRAALADAAAPQQTGEAGQTDARQRTAAALDAWLARLEAALEPFAAAMAQPAQPLGTLLRAHIAFAEWLAASDTEPGAARLWAGEAGEAAAAFVALLADGGDALSAVAPWDYPALLDALLEGEVVRPRYGRHPRLFIWGPLEARLQHADLMVLGGLNEGSWPPEPAADPWMSRPMRMDFGLAPAERRIGLSAHDFALCCAAPEVVLTRASRVEGTPSVPSRWLTRLDAVLESGGRHGEIADRAALWLHWHEALDRPERIAPAPPPAPRPPLSARPRSLSVTAIETWMIDPYAIYARHSLGLAPLEPLDADPGAAERGIIVHAILDAFVRQYPARLPADALERLLHIGRRHFQPVAQRPGVMAFWWPRFERIAAWFVDTERARRATAAPLATEVRGQLTLASPAGPFRLTAKADRIDRLTDGGLVVIDYKTGALPTKPAIQAGRAPQLPLEALLAAAGGFEEIAPEAVAGLAFWRLTGGEPAASEAPLDGEPAVLAAAAREGLTALIARFDDPETPYHPVPRPDWARPWNDYAHLARIQEWSVLSGEEGTA